MHGDLDGLKAELRSSDPTGPELRRVPLPIARVRLNRAVRQFIEVAGSFVAEGSLSERLEAGTISLPVQAIRVDLGTGKSTAVRKLLVDFVRWLRARGDTRPIIIAVPTHALAAEAAAAMAELAPDLTVETWRGRGADAPNRPGLIRPP